MNTYIFLKDVLFYSLVLLCLIISYRLIIKRLSKGRHIPSDFCSLYPLDVNPSKGDISFYFTTELVKNVRITVENEDNLKMELANKAFDKGGHIIRFDTTSLADGLYFYCLTTDVQETKKKFRISNN